MRTLVHPGRIDPERAYVRAISCSPVLRLDIASGHDLLTAIEGKLAALDAAGGSFVLVSGRINRLTIMTGGAGRDALPIGFCGPHHIEVPLDILAGAGSTGVDTHGAFFSHCHAVFRDVTGRLVGGHLINGKTIAGPEGMVIDLIPFLNGRFAQSADHETGFTIFYPEAA